MRWLALALLCTVDFARPACAHEVPPSVVMLDIGGEHIDVELQLPLSELGSALDLPVASDARSIVANQGERISAYLRSGLALRSSDGRPFSMYLDPLTTQRTSNVNWTSNDWIVAHARFDAPAHASTETFSIDDRLIVDRVLSHETLVYVRHDIRNGQLGDQALAVGRIGFGETQLRIDGSAGSWWKGLRTLFSLGLHHIGEGSDHLLFLLTLLLPAPMLAAGRRWQTTRPLGESLRAVVGTISGFTIGHSIALAGASFGWIALPSRAVETTIAVSILVCALHAWKPLFAGRETALAAAFGLIHGLAFAETLSGLDFDGQTLAVSLLGFNLGIEAMQLAIVAAMLPLLLAIAQTRLRDPARNAGAAFAAICACGWIAERTLGWPNPLGSLVEAFAKPSGAILIGTICASLIAASWLVFRGNRFIA